MNGNAEAKLIVSVMVLSLGLCFMAKAGMETVWSHDYGTDKAKDKANLEIVKDKLAPGGKALRLPFVAGSVNLPGCNAADLLLAGPVTFVAHVRAEGLIGLSQEFSLKAALRDQKDGEQYEASTMVQVTRVPSDKYVALTFHVGLIQLPAEPKRYRLSIARGWAGEVKDRTPVVWVARIEMKANGKKAAYISEVDPDKVCYRPGQEIKTRVSVVNPTETLFEGMVIVEERYGLETRNVVAKQQARIEPGKVGEFSFSWKAERPEAGREVHVTLLDNAGNPIDNNNAYFGIARDPSFLVTTGQFAGGMYPPALKLKSQIRAARQMKAAGQHRGEVFSWSYCELGSFMPPEGEDPYLGRQMPTWVSLKGMKRGVRLMKEIGMTPISYLAGPAWGIAAYELYQRHPEWFVYSEGGEIGMYDMENRAKYMRRDDFEFVPYNWCLFWGELDATNPEIRRYIADQIIKVAKEMGWEGGRWDVWNMGVGMGSRTIVGKLIAKTGEEADRLTAESLRALKEMVAKALPDFTWGYNMVAPERNATTPLTMAEKCRGGGWLLDETVCSYYKKTSPYHYWAAYRDRIIGWNDHCRKLGGIYNPYPLRRGGGKYPVDRLYESIICQAGGGRYGAYGPYENEAGLVGRIGRMVFRYSELFFGWNYDLQKEDQKLVQVDAPETLWWKQMIFRNKSHAGRPQTIVHLVNSPVSEEVEENPGSLVRLPVTNVKVTCFKDEGQLPQKAWVVTAEPMTPDGEPEVQAVPMKLAKEKGAVSVTVPSVLFWKVVVFEY
ncbi:MAG: hypothetical protein L6437_09075 [Kiritimatiellae bacterium]|nr:hypothetical protein [Verrucomicrobiota bacterium]MCG2660382.1 hypothetical protein [Kiritimatiellia bacterium]